MKEKHECEECFDTGIRIIRQRPGAPGGSIHLDCHCTENVLTTGGIPEGTFKTNTGPMTEDELKDIRINVMKANELIQESKKARKRSYALPSTKISGPRRDDESLVDYNLRCFRRKRNSMVNREFDFTGYCTGAHEAQYRVKTYKEGSFYHVGLYINEVSYAGVVEWRFISASPSLETRRDMERVAENHIKHRCDKEKWL